MPNPPQEPRVDAGELSRLWQQDVEIDVLVRQLIQSLDRDDLEAARGYGEALERFLLEHLQREEDVYFPAAQQLDPSVAPSLSTIRIAHGGIRADVQEIRERLVAGHLAAARELASAFLDSFTAHEEAEDRLIGALGMQRPA